MQFDIITIFPGDVRELPLRGDHQTGPREGPDQDQRGRFARFYDGQAPHGGRPSVRRGGGHGLQARARLRRGRIRPARGRARLSPLARRAAASTAGLAAEMASHPEVVLICGRYEGVDERVAEHLATDEISIGDYVLTGGELAGHGRRGRGVAVRPRRRRQGRIRAERFVLRGPAGLSPVHPAPRVPGDEGPPGPLLRGPSKRSTNGGAARRWRRRESGGPTSSTRSPCPKRTAGFSIELRTKGTSDEPHASGRRQSR